MIVFFLYVGETPVLQTKNANNVWSPDGNNLLKIASNNNFVTMGTYVGDNVEVSSAPIYLEGGRDYPIVIDHRQSDGPNYIRKIGFTVIDGSNPTAFWDFNPFWFPEAGYITRPTRHGAYGCIGIERETKQSSYISLIRPANTGNAIPPTQDYESGLPYYGSSEGSEMLLFLQSVIAGEQHVGSGYNYDRFYIDVPSDTAGVAFSAT